MTDIACGVAAVFLCLTAFTVQYAGASIFSPRVSGEAHVVDGDSIEIGGEYVRLWAIDAPESAQTCGSAPDPIGQHAQAHLATLIAGRPVSCERLEDNPIGGRIGVCRAGRDELGARMVADGWAWSRPHYGDAYDLSERRAREEHRGLWALGEREGFAVSTCERPPEWQARATVWSLGT